ncbi:MAG: acyltransferase [Ilumatobacteraceae bacterium]
MERPDRRAFEDMTAGGRIRQQPGLEGLRGLAVAAVVIFHTGEGWLPGGFLGVSLFFTISGVVIGSVLLKEVRSTGSMAVGGFFARRARRLYPAAWTVLAAVALLRVTTTVLAGTSGADIVTSFLQVANWHFVFQGTSYSDLFAGPPAVLHFWSLAIEEQLYLVVGIGTALIARYARRPDRMLGVLAACGALVSFALPMVFRLGIDRTYYGTDTRSGEVFAGLVVAAVIADGGRRRWLLDRASAFAALGAVALVATAVAWRIVPAGHDAIRLGLLPATALTSCLVVFGALVPGGPVWAIAGLAPLRWLGGISYGLYLVHFPVFVIVERVEPHPGIVTILTMIAVAVGLAVLSARFVEWPVRAGRVRGRGLVVGGVALGVVAAAALVLPARTTDADDFLSRLEDAAEARADISPSSSLSPSSVLVPPPSTIGSPTSAPSTSPSAPGVSAPPEPTVVGWYGDSVALSLLFASSTYVTDGPVRFGDLYTAIGCGVALAPPSEVDRCSTALDTAISKIPASGATVGIVMSCQWELLPSAIPGVAGGTRQPDDPDYEAFVRERFERAIDRLRAGGLQRVLWVLCPHQSLSVGIDNVSAEFRDGRDPRRVDHLNELVAEIAAERDDVTTVDLPSWVNPRVDDSAIRQDGSHYVWERDTGVSAVLATLVAAALAEPG